ncbi:MAG: hypothetical protein HC912_00605 [Saprospiraceae bacterium]|nr:hypothetical protein [Saprospiraceae bacterium]
MLERQNPYLVEQMFTINMNRRKFLQHTAWTTVVPSAIPSWRLLRPKQQKKKLIVIQLNGGNDSWNTLIPYQNQQYYKYRPTLALPPDAIIPLTASLGFHPALASLQPFF